MAGVHAQPVPLAVDERQILASLAEHALEPAGERLVLAARHGGSGRGAADCLRDVIEEAEALARIFEAAQDGSIDVADPLVRTWLGRRRDALLALLRDDRAALYDSLAARHATAEASVEPAIAQRWRLVDEDLEELALVARLLSDALDEG
ncbi:hypothetical protein [Baekduia sp.]|jgi:hypothetical protein|uniref:hypothetical protein n=1 Tax=Baekduia sp. TaxID=2600305 RepID=UPI002DFDD722|nr:hypothetical protein [Baekduia sp.]